MNYLADQQDREFLGRGWSFPIHVDQHGEISLSAFEEDVREAIRIILGTTQGERVMRPDFGAGLKKLVFQPMNTTTRELARHRVEEALIRWEPRIDNINVEVSPEQARGQLKIEIQYRVRATNTFYNLVYPFYLLEGERA